MSSTWEVLQLDSTRVHNRPVEKLQVFEFGYSDWKQSPTNPAFSISPPLPFDGIFHTFGFLKSFKSEFYDDQRQNARFRLMVDSYEEPLQIGRSRDPTSLPTSVIPVHQHWGGEYGVLTFKRPTSTPLLQEYHCEFSQRNLQDPLTDDERTQFLNVCRIQERIRIEASACLYQKYTAADNARKHTVFGQVVNFWQNPGHGGIKQEVFEDRVEVYSRDLFSY